MARIVTGGRTRKVVERTVFTGTRKILMKRFAAQGHGADVSVCGIGSIQRVDEDLALVKSYFDVNTSRAFRLALRLTAKAIRVGKLQL